MFPSGPDPRLTATFRAERQDWVTPCIAGGRQFIITAVLCHMQSCLLRCPALGRAEPYQAQLQTCRLLGELMGLTPVEFPAKSNAMAVAFVS